MSFETVYVAMLDFAMIHIGSDLQCLIFACRVAVMVIC